MSGLLMPEFPSEQGNIYFDFAEVRALQEDEDALVSRKLTQAQIAKELIIKAYSRCLKNYMNLDGNLFMKDKI